MPSRGSTRGATLVGRSIAGNIKRLEYCDFFVLFTTLMCSDSIFNLLKRVTDGSFLFLCETLVFLFLTFLNLGAQMRCLQNRYTDLKSALDQPLNSSNIDLKSRLKYLQACLNVSIEVAKEKYYRKIVRPIKFNFSFIVGRPHCKIISQNAPLQLIICLTTRKKSLVCFVSKCFQKQKWKDII